MPQPDCPILLSGCPGVDSPITNTSAEAADTFQWAAQIWSPWDPYRPPPLGDGMSFKQDCTALAGQLFANFDPIVFADTQAMANIIALGQSLGCPWNIPEVSGVTLQNDAQSATVTCPDGSSFTYQVEAGLYQIDAAILCGYPTDTVTFVKSGGATQTITHTGCFVQFTYDQLLGSSTNSATWLCVDGHSITNSVGGGYVSAASQACSAWVQMANDWAQAEALYQATSLMDCITKDDPQAPGDNPPALTPGPGILTTPTWVCLGEEFFSSYNISGRGSASYTIEVISGTLPPGLTFTQTDSKRATLSGTTTTAGEYTFTIKGTATLLPYSVVQATVTVFVFGLVSDLLPDATENVAYSETLSADGGTAPYAFALDPDSDPLPTGLTLASDGTVSGTPTVDGDYVLTVAITDSNGGVCSQDVSLHIEPSGIDWSTMVWVTSKSGAVSLVVPTVPGGTQDNCQTYIQAANTLSSALASATGTINYTGPAVPIHFSGSVIKTPAGSSPPENQTGYLRITTKIGAAPSVISYIIWSDPITPPGAIAMATGPFSVGFTIPDTGGENCLITVDCVCSNVSAFGPAYELDITATITND